MSVYTQNFNAANIATITNVSVLTNNFNIVRATSQRPLTSLKRTVRYQLWNVTDGVVLAEGYYIVADSLMAMSTSSGSLSSSSQSISGTTSATSSSSSSNSSSSADSIDDVFQPLLQDWKIARGTTPLLSFSPVDRGGHPQSPLGHNLRLIAYDANLARFSGYFSIPSSSFIITSTKAIVRLTTQQTAVARNLSYFLWDLDENRPLFYGRLLIEERI